MSAPYQNYVEQTFPYLDNTQADIRLLGFPALLCPFLQKTSASRVDMFASHFAQHLVIKGREYPRISTGLEYEVGTYEYNTTGRDQDAQILANIPKYPIRRGINQIGENPSYTIIYLGLEDKMIHSFNIDRFTLGSDGFGYENVFLKHHLLHADSYLPKDEIICTSPSHAGKKYMPGVNAQVCYMAIHETIEDAMVISESFARKLSSLEIHRKTITIKAGVHPVNHHGDANTYKFIPDIGERVKDDGILCTFRPVSTGTFLADIHQPALGTVQSLHDESYYVPPNSEIIDIDFYVNRAKPIPEAIYGQIEKYQASTQNYWQQIIHIYQKYKKEYRLAPEFNTLVSTAIGRLSAAGIRIQGIPTKNKVVLKGKDGNPIDFIQMEVTYACERKDSNGFKQSDRYGTRPIFSTCF